MLTIFTPIRFDSARTTHKRTTFGSFAIFDKQTKKRVAKKNTDRANPVHRESFANRSLSANKLS
jgi:hypothetical protein